MSDTSDANDGERGTSDSDERDKQARVRAKIARYSRLEEDLDAFDIRMTSTSQAVSLKRIADALDKLVAMAQRAENCDADKPDSAS